VKLPMVLLLVSLPGHFWFLAMTISMAGIYYIKQRRKENGLLF